MPIIATNEGNFEQPPTGLQQAVCVFVHDIGTQKGDYMGKPTEAHKVIVSWELGEKMTTGDYAGKPFMISKYYTLSLSEKANLRKDLESWRGQAFSETELEGFDVEKLIGANCYLNLVKNDKGKVVISAITQLPKGAGKLVPVNTVPSENYMKWINRERAKSVEATQSQTPVHVSEQEQPKQEGDLPF